MNKYKSTIIIIILSIGVAAGIYFYLQQSKPKEIQPNYIADAFWSRLIAGDTATASQLTMDSDQVSLKFNGATAQDTYQFIGMQTSATEAILDTTIIVHRNQSLHQIPVKTVLKKTNVGWRVDYETTKNSLYDAVIEQTINHVRDKTLMGVSILESTMPRFKEQDDSRLHSEVQKFTNDLGDELYERLIHIRQQASNKHFEVNGKYQKRRQDMIDGIMDTNEILPTR